MHAGLYRYRLGPFVISSEIPLPELTPAESGKPNVWISLGQAPKRIEGVVAHETRWWASKTEYLQRVQDVGTFHVKDGRTITIEPAPGSLAGDIRAYLLAPIFTSLCFQSGMYALHASSVKTAAGVVAFLGQSGAGKSTLAAHLAQRGFDVVSDDFCLLGPFVAEDRGPLVIPVAPAVKLWRSALTQMGMGPEGLPQVWSQEDKYRLRLRESNERLPLRELYFLEWSESGDSPEFERMAGPEAITRLLSMLHFEYLMKPAGRLTESFLLCGRLLRAVPAYSLRRPKEFSRFGEVVDRLEARIGGLARIASGKKAQG